MVITKEQKKQLRIDFYSECTDMKNGWPEINSAPYNIFNWFMDNIEKLEDNTTNLNNQEDNLYGIS